MSAVDLGAGGRDDPAGPGQGVVEVTDPDRERRLSNAFVRLADTLVADFDLVDLLQTLVDACADVLDASAAGLMLKSATGELHVMVSTTEDAEFVELAQLGAAAGPCWECARTGVAVAVADVSATGKRWPAFRRAAMQRGFRSAHATPLRLREEVIGTLNLFGSEVGVLGPADVAAAQALSDVATIGILGERTARGQRAVAVQLQHALDSRVVIEQAKGILTQTCGITMDDAFISLRSFARSNDLGIRSVAMGLIDHELDPGRVATDSALRRAAAVTSARRAGRVAGV